MPIKQEGIMQLITPKIIGGTIFCLHAETKWIFSSYTLKYSTYCGIGKDTVLPIKVNVGLKINTLNPKETGTGCSEQKVIQRLLN